MSLRKDTLRTKNDEFSSAKQNTRKEWVSIRYPMPLSTHLKVIEVARMLGIHYANAYYFILEFAFDGKSPKQLIEQIDQNWIDDKAREQEERI
jgi:hypothetical protein